MHRLIFAVIFIFIIIATPHLALAETDTPDKDALTEESTFLTFPEWYIVFSAQDYAQFLKHGGKPSHFRYLDSVKNYWETYFKVTKYTIDHKYPFNFGNHLMLGVIGISYSGEYLTKGLYENTLGAASERWANGELTPEDIYAQKVAEDYGQFLTHTPWYDFPFYQKLKDLWTQTPFLSTSPFRSLERKFALSLEYEFKAIYGSIIHYASGGVYAPPNPEVLTKTSAIPQEILNQNMEIKVVENNPDNMVVSLPRYDKFTNSALKLLREDVQFYDLSGNKQILITTIVDKEWQYNLVDSELLFETPIYSQITKKRLAIRVPLGNLHLIIKALDEKGFSVEHLFDY